MQAEKLFLPGSGDSEDQFDFKDFDYNSGDITSVLADDAGDFILDPEYLGIPDALLDSSSIPALSTQVNRYIEEPSPAIPVHETDRHDAINDGPTSSHSGPEQTCVDGEADEFAEFDSWLQSDAVRIT
jgi:hypothetical protein